MGRILHFGLGNFARAHLLDYTADAGQWDVVGVSLRSAETRNRLAKQGFGYTLGVQGIGPKKITILRNILVAPEDPHAVLDGINSADIISATVTEKGYHLDANGQLDLSDSAIAQDLKTQAPSTLISYLAFGLSTRTTPVTILSCDNRIANGQALKRAVKQFAKAAHLTLDWSLFTFPNAMVDRITPATTDALRNALNDPMAVPTEPFREWVIEDDFAGQRPDWPDVQFVRDVAPHELRKIRMLNGAHSLLAYSGIARGHEFVHQAIADPVLHDRVLTLMNEATKTLPIGANDPSGAYASALVKRFENPELRHALRQIAMDGSQKTPYRFIETIRDLLEMGEPADALVHGLKSWINFCIEETREGLILDDPKAHQIAHAVQSNDPVFELLKLVNAVDLHPLMQE
ncbi:MAG: mannitol dehydrogenase family protein [Ascidiaceihabitans sp.]|nr:mannitol dehydrogenase family protein [Ascidiaceihabitans sp.]